MFKNNLNEYEAIRNINSEIQRYDVINYLIDKYNLNNYLEIGVFNGENIRKVKASHKDAVDPGAEGIVAPEVNYPITSDVFFELIKDCDDIKYDIIFIDGLHHSEQVTTDIENSLKHIIDNGFIVLHDCNPISYEAQLVPRETIVWNGDVWKSIIQFRQRYPKMQSCVIDTDFGVGVIKVNDKTISDVNIQYNWQQFSENKIQMLNLVSWEEFKKMF